MENCIRGIRVLKKCIDCEEEFNAKTKEKRCKECQNKYRDSYQQEYLKEYNKRYRADKPKSVFNPKYYQYWKYADTLTDEELQALYQVRKQKLKYSSTWEERQEIKTHMKILTDIYKQREGDRVLNKIGAMEVDDERFHKEMMENE